MSYVQIVNNAIPQGFYDLNPEFDILQFNFHGRAEADSLIWSDGKNVNLANDRESILDALKTYQRLLRINPDQAVADALIAEGYTSANKITIISEDNFVTAVADSINEGAAREIHQKAVDITRRTHLHLAIARDAVASPHYAATLPYNVQDDLIEFHQGMEGYQDLFGSLDYCACEHCRSIFSPAAYFVDLMRLAGQYITKPTDDALGLSRRRPDLWTIPLDCDHTNTEVPYLQIAKEVMEAKLAADLGTDSRAYLAGATYPFNLPYNAPLEQIRAYLAHFQLDLATIYKTFGVADASQIAREYLGLSLAAAALITTNKADDTAALSRDFGLDDIAGLSRVTTFMAQTGLTRDQLTELLYQGVGKEEVESADRFFINQTLAGGTNLKIVLNREDPTDIYEEIENLDPPSLDRLNRFIRLAAALEWSYADLDWVLHSLGAADIDSNTLESIAKVKRLQATYDLSLDDLASLWADMKTIGRGDGDTPADLFDKVYNAPTVFYNPGNSQSPQPYRPEYAGNDLFIDSVLSWAYSDRSDATAAQIRSRLASALTLGDADLTALTDYLVSPDTVLVDRAGDPLESGVPIPMSVENLTVFYRYARWAAILGFTIDELLSFLKLIDVKIESGGGASAAIDRVVALCEQADWLKANDITVHQLQYVFTGETNSYVDPGYVRGDVPALQGAIVSAAQSGWLVGKGAFISDDGPIDEAQSQDTFSQLVEQNCLDSNGVVLNANKFSGDEAAQINETLKNYRDLQRNGVLQALTDFFNGKSDLVTVIWDHVVTATGIDNPVQRLLTAVPTDADLDADIYTLIDSVARHLYTASLFSLTATETRNVFDHPQWFDIAGDIESAEFASGSLHSVSTFKALVTAFNDATDEFIGYFKDASGNSYQSLAEITGWDGRQIGTVVSRFDWHADREVVDTVAKVAALKDCFDIAALLGTDVDTLIGLCSVDTGPTDTGTHFTAYQTAAAALFDAVKSKYSDADWDDIIDPINAELLEGERDRLVPLLIWRLQRAFPDITTAQDLYEFLLIDIEMEGCASISHIKQGLDSLQLYIERCRKNLEPEVASKIPDTWWSWMSNYRVWEANRKVFAYPENYIDPSLRASKTDLFADVENRLLQGEITADSVEEAYHHYFAQYEELAKLKIVDSYCCTIADPTDGKPEHTLFLFARTRTTPYTFYYRQAVVDGKTSAVTSWAPWEKVDLAPNADTIASVYAFNRLFIFWAELAETTHKTGVSGNLHETTATRATIKYSFQRAGGDWVQPQTLLADQLIYVVSDLPKKKIKVEFPTYDDSWMRNTSLESVGWQKPYPLHIPKQASDCERIAVFYGDNAGEAKTYQPRISAVLTEDLLVEEALFRCADSFEWASATFDSSRRHLNFMAATSVGKLALFAGGRANNQYSKAVEIYNIATGEWASGDWLQTARQGLAATSVGNLALFAGGAAPPHYSDLVNIYNADTGEWRTEKLSRGRSELAATSVNNLALFAGGRYKTRHDLPSNADAPSNAVDIYNADTGAWKTEHLSHARWGLAATTVGNLAIFAGGTFTVRQAGDKLHPDRFLRRSINAVDIYNADTGAWKTERLPHARWALVATSVGDLAIFAGGRDDDNKIDDLAYIYNTKTGKWTTKHLSSARQGMAATSVGNLAFFAGGRNGYGVPSDAVDIYNSDTDEWTTGTLSNARWGLAATTAGDLAIFAGGLGEGGETNQGNSVNIVDIYFNQGPEAGLVNEGQLEVALSDNIIRDNFLSDQIPITEKQKITLLAKAEGQNVEVLPVRNQSGWSIFDNGDEAFLVAPKGSPVDSISASLVVDTDGKTVNLTSICGYSPMGFEAGQYSFTRLTTAVARTLSQRLFAGGLPHLLTLDSQQAPELDFDRLSPNADTAIAPAGDALSFNGAYGIYNWELFFHIPFLVASSLNAHQKFEDAQRWYQYIFNPTAAVDGDGHSADRFWQFLPFRGREIETLQEYLGNSEEIRVYEDDPFDPNAIAGLRIGAYEKAIVMRYIDNLLDWADLLFSQYTWETITEARMLYVLASDLLGPQPALAATAEAFVAKSYQDILAAPEDHVPDFLVALENAGYTSDDSMLLSNLPFRTADAYFCVVENADFMGYWARVADRLYKIRHCLTIDGVAKQLSLFEPPIDPAQLVGAAAASSDITRVMTKPGTTVPHYRFTAMIAQAKNMASSLSQFGSALLGALEKQDAEQLALLRSTHEQTILNLLTTVKEKAVEEADINQDLLDISLESAGKRYDYYKGLMDSGLSTYETNSQNLMIAAIELQARATLIKGASAGAHLVPTVFGFANGDFSPGEAVMAGAQVLESVSQVLNQGASLAATQGQFARRTEEWALQQTLADYDKQQITQQIALGEIRQAIARQDLNAHRRNVDQAAQTEDFLQSKFSDRALYQWMVNSLSTIYFQYYKLAFDTAQAAEKAYQYELNTNDSFLSFGYWDSLKKGLLAGERLTLGLNQLENAYTDNHKRELEIEKNISLLQLDPQALLDLRNKGYCDINLTESLFDYDFPGHYNRRIKTIALSIPAVVGPYQSIQATLIQQSNQVVTATDLAVVKFLLNGDELDDTNPNLRSNWRPNQQIAVSRGVDDSGMFELNFRDERYLPFEGTGAISKWQLRMPKRTNRINFNSISDVIIHLRYTAVPGGDEFARDVMGEMTGKKFAGNLFISLSQEFSTDWHNFINSEEADPQLEIPLVAAMFPNNISVNDGDFAVKSVSAAVLGEDGASTKLEPSEVAEKIAIREGNGADVVKTVAISNIVSASDLLLIIAYEGALAGEPEYL